MEIHGKFNPVIRTTSVPFDARRILQFGDHRADREMGQKFNFLYVFIASTVATDVVYKQNMNSVIPFAASHFIEKPRLRH